MKNKSSARQIVLFVFLLLMGLVTVLIAEKFLHGTHDTAADQLQYDLDHR